MGASDLFVAVTRRKLACVVDPLLALGTPHGTALALRLAQAFEAWLPRSFWQVLDASELIGSGAGLPCDPQPDDRALVDWLALRDLTDAGSWVWRWVGDNVADSQLRDAATPDLVERTERLLDELLARLPESEPDAPWTPCGDALRGAPDVLAPSAALQGALVLCPASPQGADGRPPPLVALAEMAGLVPEGPEPVDGNGLWQSERLLVRDALAGAGAVPLLQGLPRLAVLHVLPLPGGGWDGARAWWYWV